MLITTGGCESIKFVKIFTFFVYKLFFQKLQILRYLYFYWVFLTFSCCFHINIAEFLKEKERLVWVTKIFTEKEKYITKMIWWIAFFFCFFLFVQFLEVLLIFLIDQKQIWVGKFNQKCKSTETASLSNNHYFIYEN